MISISILNDALGEIEKHSEDFVKKIIEHKQIVENTGQVSEFGIGYYGNGMTVNSVEHSNHTTILAVGGNCTTVLGTTNSSIHHTEESQVEILKQLANKLGYDLVQK